MGKTLLQSQPQSPRQLAIYYYVLAVAVLSYYSTTVSPYMASLSASHILGIFLAGFVCVAVAKFLLEPRFIDKASGRVSAVRQFCFEILLYVLVGAWLTVFTSIVLDFPYGAGNKVIFGCLAFGAFAALDIAILRERESYAGSFYLAKLSAKIIPITRKLFIAFSFIVAFTCIIMALTVINEVDFLMSNMESFSPSRIWKTVLVDVAFIIGVVLLLSLQVIRSYSENLKKLFNMQIAVLEKVESGNFETHVPVVTRDEFGVIAEKTNQTINSLKLAKQEETQLLETVMAISMEMNLRSLLLKIIQTASALLNAERSSVFLYDRKTDELWTIVAEGVDHGEIRIPSSEGIAGNVFTTGKSENIADAYSDERFNQDVDKITGYKTRCILCMPIIDSNGNHIGVIQALNKQNGIFTISDENRLRAFCAQAAIALNNASQFEEINNMRKYNESILRSLNDGVITIDNENRIVKANDAAQGLLGYDYAIEGMKVEEIFNEQNSWIIESIEKVSRDNAAAITMDSDILVNDGKTASVNLNAVPLLDLKDKPIGSMLVFEDITSEKRVRSTMARYMTKEVADRLLEGGADALGGSAHVATVLFSDIRGFTSLSEELGARETVAMLNEYFSAMTDAIFQHQGILDKYIGDAIMAVFGAPFSSTADTDNAVSAAIHMMKALRRFNKLRRQQEQNYIDIGIGISTGEVVAGNIGSPKRMDYTVIGDTVNLASRLEGANKYYGTQILVSENTKNELTRDYLYREVDSIRVKGKRHPVAVYEILDFHDTESFPSLDLTLQCYKNGLSAYRQLDWSQAISYFEAALKLTPNDGPSRLYLERCEYFLNKPPSQEWDGVWSMEGK